MRPAATRPLFFRDAAQLLTLAGPPAPRRGRELGELGIIPRGAVLTEGARILRVGTTAALKGEARRLRARVIECRGRVVMPGFVDSHTHLVFAGNRVEDFERRIRGASYEEIARAGGGIQHSARLLDAASEHELRAGALRFLSQFVVHGTTAVEVKTGYGLSVENELKILRVIRRLQGTAPVELVPTLMALHALPSQYAKQRDAYVRLIAQRLIPEAAKEKLARFVDCFCDRGAFTVAECWRIMGAAARHGFMLRLHAEQLARTGGARLAVKLGAAAADHLDHVNESDMRVLARSNTVATLLPGSNFHLGLAHYPPARRLIDAGAVVALATDFNPGSSPTVNMQFILSLACSQLRMMPGEAIGAATINAAFSLGLSDRIGSLEPGKQADLIAMDCGDYREIPYYFAWNQCVMTVKRGRVVYSTVKD